MKISLLSLCVFLTLSFSVSAKTVFISDIDDTIKMTGDKHQTTGRPVVDLLLHTQNKIIQECKRR
jgi:phosphatidate phosphatase APP1